MYNFGRSSSLVPSSLWIPFLVPWYGGNPKRERLGTYEAKLRGALYSGGNSPLSTVRAACIEFTCTALRYLPDAKESG